MVEPPTSYCPNGLAEYRPGFGTCADRAVKLVRGPAPMIEERARSDTEHHAHPSEDRHRVPVVVWVLGSQPDGARAITQRSLRGDQAI